LGENISHKTRFSNTFYWLVALSFFYTGFHLTEINYMELEWFTRSGCMVVVLGVWASLGVVLKEKVLVQKITWKRNQAFAKSKFRILKGKKHPTLNEAEIAEINSTCDTELASQLQHLRMSIGALEVSLLISGTLVWGFGDIVLNLSNLT
jgi:uncharacterized membrane protein YcjF (UPF0283 family)